jgi:FixJ family two-component response regulator
MNVKKNLNLDHDLDQVQTASMLVRIIDDDASLRVALSRLLMASGYRTVLYASAAEFLQSANALEPGCILLDVNMPGLNGLQLQEHLVTLKHALPIVFLTGQGSIAASVRAIKAGAEDYLSKPVDKVELLDAIQRAVHRYTTSTVQHAHLEKMSARFELLTAREREVFGLLMSGMLNKQIAFQLGNTERTVKAHRHCIMEKMQAKTLAELIVIASQLGKLD